MSEIDPYNLPPNLTGTELARQRAEEDKRKWRKKIMDWTTIATLMMRHILTAAGGAIVAKGWATDSMVEAIMGAITSLAGVGWAVFNKRPAAIAKQAIKTDGIAVRITNALLASKIGAPHDTLIRDNDALDKK